MSKKFINSLSNLSKSQLEKRDIYGRTLLHLVCILNRYDALRKLLLNPNLQLDVTDYENGWNCLHFAVFHKHFIITRILLAADKSNQLIKAKDRDGFTPIDLLSSDSVTGFKWIPESIGRIHRYGKSHKHRNQSSYDLPIKEVNVEARMILPDCDDKKDHASIVKQAQHADELTLSQLESMYMTCNFPTCLPFLPVRGGSDLLYWGLSSDVAGTMNRLTPVNMHSLKLHYGDPTYYSRLSDRISSPRIAKVVMSNQHRVVLTCEPRANIFVAGIGSKGRLGIVGSSRVGKGFMPVEELSSEKVVDVDVSDDHTVCLTSTNKIFTWGSNSYGQLGYPFEKARSQLDSIQTLPKQVNLGDIRKNVSDFIGVTCSRFHTIAYTKQNMFIWGLNIGQFGFSTEDKSSKLFRSVKGTDSNMSMMVEIVPRKLEFKHGIIRQVSASDHVTLVLNEKDEIHAYLRGFHAKIVPPLLSEINESNFNAFRPRVLSKRKKVVRMITQKECKACMLLYDNGDIEQFTIDTQARNSVDFLHMVKFTTIWTASKKHLCCVDADIGNDQSLIICVADGSVYKRKKRMKVKRKYSGRTTVFKRYKFTRVDGANRVVRVVADPDFNKFLFVRDDVDLLPHRLPKSTIYRDVSRLSPLYELDSRYLQKRTTIDESSVIRYTKKNTVNANFVYPMFGPQNNVEEEPQESDKSGLYQSINKLNDRMYKNYLSRWILNPDNDRVRLPEKDTQNIEELLRSDNLEYLLSLKDLRAPCKYYNFKVVVKDTVYHQTFIFGAHREWLCQRCPIISNVVGGKRNSIDSGGIKLSMDSSTDNTLIIEGKVTIRSVGILLHFLYTDKFIDVWSQFPLGSIPSEIQRTKTAFEALSRMVGVVNPVGRIQCINTLLDDMQILLDGSRGQVQLKLSDGLLHAPVSLLCVRSVYFETLFRWKDMEESKLLSISFPDFTKKEFKVILRFLAGSNIDEIFMGLEFDSSEEFIDFCLDIIEISDMILLGELSDICQLCIKDFISYSNVCYLLEEASSLDATKLFENCIWYLYNNLELLMLDNNFFNVNKKPGMKLLKQVDAGIKWFNELGSVNGPALSTDVITNSSMMETHSNGLITQFVNEIKSFDSHFIHPLLWDALGSFKEENDLGKSKRHNIGSKGKTKSESRSSSGSFSRRSSIRGSGEASSWRRPSSSRSNSKYDFNNESAIIGDDEVGVSDSGFVVVSHNHRSSNSRHRGSSSGPALMSESVSHNVIPGSVPVSAASSISSTIPTSVPLSRPTSSMRNLNGRRSVSRGPSPSSLIASHRHAVGSSPHLGSVVHPTTSMPTLDDVLKIQSSHHRAHEPSRKSFSRPSQKERRRMAAVAVETTKKKKVTKKQIVKKTQATAPWDTSKTWKKVVPVTPINIDISAPLIGSSTSNAPTTGNVWGNRAARMGKNTSVVAAPSLDSILLEEKLEEQMKEKERKKSVSLEDIQREEEFDEWWEKESARVQAEMKRQKQQGMANQQGNRKARHRMSRGGRGGHGNSAEHHRRHKHKNTKKAISTTGSKA